MKLSVSVIVKIVLLLSLGVFFIFTSHRAQQGRITSESTVRMPPWINLSPLTISLLTLGFKAAYDDFLAIWIVHYLASPDTSIYDLDSLDNMLQKTAAIRHPLESIYMFSCFTLTMLKRPRSCETILHTGMEVLPDGWRLPLTMGFVYAFDLDEPRKAAIYYNACSERENAPTYIKNVARKLAKKGGVTLNQLDNSLAEILGISENSKIYKVLKQKYKTRGAEKSL